MTDSKEVSSKFRIFSYSAMAVLTLAGIAISILLLIMHYYPSFGGGAVSCGADCAALSTSGFSSLFGVPLPLYSLYFFITVCVIETGFMLYGRDSFRGFIYLMIPLYAVAATFCLFLGSVMIYYRSFCPGCVALYVVVIFSLILMVTSFYKTSADRSFKSVIAGRFSSLMKSELRPALFFLIIIMVMLIPALSYVDILVRTSFVRNQITADNAKKFADELYASNPVELTLPESIMTSGDKSAKISFVVFTDFMCSACSKNNEVLSDLMKKYPKDLYIQYYNYPLDRECNSDIKITLYKNSCVLSKYMVVASLEGVFNNMHDFYYRNYNEIKNSVKRDNFVLINQFLASRGKLLRPDIELQAKKIIERDIELARTLDLQSTPVMYINGRKIDGSYPFEFIDEVIQREISK